MSYYRNRDNEQLRLLDHSIDDFIDRYNASTGPAVADAEAGNPPSRAAPRVRLSTAYSRRAGSVSDRRREGASRERERPEEHCRQRQRHCSTSRSRSWLASAL